MALRFLFFVLLLLPWFLQYFKPDLSKQFSYFGHLYLIDGTFLHFSRLKLRFSVCAALNSRVYRPCI